MEELPNKPPPRGAEVAVGPLELALAPNPVELPQLEPPKFIIRGAFRWINENVRKHNTKNLVGSGTRACRIFNYKLLVGVVKG